MDTYGEHLLKMSINYPSDFEIRILPLLMLPLAAN